MSVRLAALNTAEGLGDLRLKPTIKSIEKIDADIVVVSEAFATYEEDPTDKVTQIVCAIKDATDQLGYQVAYTPYEDAEWGSDPTESYRPFFQRYLIVLGRSALLSSHLVRLNSRNALEMTVQDPDDYSIFRGFGVHFDDRANGNRSLMACNLTGRLQPGEPAFLGGDLNVMNPNQPIARVMRSKPVKWIAQHTPTVRGQSLVTRPVDMAEGLAYSTLTDFGFEDADPNGQPTFRVAKVPLFTLDHIMTVGGLRAHDFERTSVPGSDHLAISAHLSIGEPNLAA